MRTQTDRLSVAACQEGFLLAKGAEGRSPRTLQDYAYCIGMLSDWLAARAEHGAGVDVSVAELTTTGLRAFFVYLQQRQPPLSARTIRNVHIALSSLWSWLGEELGMPHIVKPIKAPKAPPPAMQLPTRDEIPALLKACDYAQEARTGRRRPYRTRRPTALRDRCLITMLIDTGLRASELCALTIGDVSTGAVLVRKGKGAKQRIVYVGKATRRRLWRYTATQRQGTGPDDPLFTGRSGAVGHALTHLVHDLGQRAGVKVHPHMLRHVFATEFLRGGGSTPALRRLGT